MIYTVLGWEGGPGYGLLFGSAHLPSPSGRQGRQAGKNWVTRKERNGRIHCCDDGGPAGPRLVQGGRAGNNGRQLFFFSRNDPPILCDLGAGATSISGLLQGRRHHNTAHNRCLPALSAPSTAPRIKAPRAANGLPATPNERISGSLVEENHCCNGDSQRKPGCAYATVLSGRL